MKFRRRFVEGMLRVTLCGVVCATAGCGSSDGGGSGNNGGSGGGPGKTDNVPPTFAGLSTATVMDDGAVNLVWDAATDNDSDPSSIAYAVYSGPKAGQEDFSAPYAFTPAGAAGITLSNVAPGDHFWVVRAVDQAGNQDDNSVEKTASPADITPPRFAGATTATVQTSRSVLVAWKPGADDATKTSQISYQIFVSSTPDPKDFTFNKPFATAKGGTTSTLVEGLDPLSTFYFIVRAVDTAGNVDANEHVVFATTPEGESPLFAGIKQINPLPEGMKLYWLPAQDNATDVANIVYDVYLTTDATLGPADTAKPAYVSPPGAVTFVVPNLVNQQRYVFRVRARDTAGNEDDNTADVAARALNGADVTAPSFNAKSLTLVGESPTTLRASWTAGSDAVTDTAHLIYNVFVSSTPDAIADDATPTLVSPPGATSILIAGLAPQSTWYVTVRCADEAGNTLSNTLSKSGTTLAAPSTDNTAPTFTTAPTVTSDPAATATSLHVTWTAGTDDTSAAAKIRYLLCASHNAADCLGANFLSHIYMSTAQGATSADLTGLASRSAYFVYVRAEDEAGLVSTTDEAGSATTPTSYSQDVVPIFFDKCNGCHSFEPKTTVGVEGGYVDTRLPVSVKSMFLVTPGEPQNSLIYRRINPLGLAVAPFTPAITNLYRGPQEPQNAQKIFAGALSGAEDGAIRDWITQGAFAN